MRDELMARISRAKLEIQICEDLLANDKPNASLSDAILDALSDEWQTVAQIAKTIKRDVANVYRPIRKLAFDGQVEMSKAPERYRLRRGAADA